MKTTSLFFGMQSEQGEHEEQDTTCVVVKLKSICRDKHFRKQLEEVVDKVTRVADEAYKLLNFHLLRLLNAKKEVPNVFNQSFLRNIIVGVTGKAVRDVDDEMVKTGRERCDKALSEMKELDEQLRILKEMRKNERHHLSKNTEGESQTKW